MNKRTFQNYVNATKRALGSLLQFLWLWVTFKLPYICGLKSISMGYKTNINLNIFLKKSNYIFIVIILINILLYNGNANCEALMRTRALGKGRYFPLLNGGPKEPGRMGFRHNSLTQRTV